MTPTPTSSTHQPDPIECREAFEANVREFQCWYENNHAERAVDYADAESIVLFVQELLARRPAPVAMGEELERYKQSNVILNREYNRLGECCDRYRKMLYEYGVACQTVVIMARHEGLRGTTSAQYWISQHTFDLVKQAIKIADELTKQVANLATITKRPQAERTDEQTRKEPLP